MVTWMEQYLKMLVLTDGGTLLWKLIEGIHLRSS